VPNIESQDECGQIGDKRLNNVDKFQGEGACSLGILGSTLNINRRFYFFPNANPG
jgi:hypothetical protein